jgi:hypothetical protein
LLLLIIVDADDKKKRKKRFGWLGRCLVARFVLDDLTERRQEQ